MADSGYVIGGDDRRVVIITTGSKNKKTEGKRGMAHVWTLVRDVAPNVAIRTGEDSLVCFSCPLRGMLGEGRACYVNTWQAPLSIWRAFQRGAYRTLTRRESVALVRGRLVRFGAYGEATVLPLGHAADMARASDGWNGYTHRVGSIDPDWRHMFMASTQDAAGYAAAVDAGWRPYHAVPRGGMAPEGALLCASERPANRRACADCLGCGGTRFGTVRQRGGWYIPVHGPGARHL